VDITSTTAGTGMVGATGTEAAITVAVDGTVAVAAASGRVAADTQAVADTAVAAAKKIPSSFAARLLMSGAFDFPNSLLVTAIRRMALAHHLVDLIPSAAFSSKALPLPS
jgi:hypothetical protein